MALVNIETALSDALRRLLKIPPGHGIEVLSYKRNRGVYIMKLSTGLFSVRQSGYEERELQCAADDLERTLRPIFRREFPRSRKVRTYNVDPSTSLPEGGRKKL